MKGRRLFRQYRLCKFHSNILDTMIRSPWMSSPYQKLEGLRTLNRQVDGHDFVVLINPEIGSWCVFTSEDYARYLNDNLTEVEWETLYVRGLAADDEGCVVETDFPSPADVPSVVVVNIATTCNLRCKYCFADCSDEKGDLMREDVMRSLISQMLSLPVPLVTFEFQGGEALCNVEGMRLFIELAEKMNESYHKVLRYRTVTNATLITDDFLELAKKYDLKVGISLDGPRDCTDRVRVDAQGKGVFDRVMDGVRRMRDSGIEVDGAVCTVGQHNVHCAKEIVDFFAENKIEFKPRPVNILGREITSNLTTKPGEWFEAYKEMYYRSKEKNINNASIHIYEENTYGPIRDYVCLRYPCGAAREIISVNPNGDVYPCDGFKGEEQFKIGNVLEESIADIMKKEPVRKLQSRTAKDIEKCRSCTFRAMCCSCCYSAFGKFGTIYREDPHCADRRLIFLFLIDEWIRNNVLNGSE